MTEQWNRKLVKTENTSSMARQGGRLFWRKIYIHTRTRTHSWCREFFFFKQNTIVMHLKCARCLSCQPAVIFINNSKNTLWNPFCFQIRSCDSFGTREHWVNCHILTCQWMVSFKVKLVMNWYLLRPKQAQGTIYILLLCYLQWWMEVRGREEVRETSSSCRPSNYK